MLHYIIQILLFQTLFLGIYDLFLKKETFFQWNRAYLIVSSILAYIIPFIKIQRVNTFVQQDLAFEIPTINLNYNTTYLNEVVISKTNEAFQLTNLELIYLTGIVITSVLFIIKIIQIYKRILKNKVILKKNYKLVLLEKQTTAFSFFNYLFLGKNIYNQEHQHIIAHELIHIKQKHSLDLIFFEIQKIAFWMNPFSYLFQNRIATLHEYIADAKAIKENPKQQFFENLLNQSFQVEKFAFVNQFYKKSLIKKRIIMATKNKSKEILKLKYLLSIPLISIMLIVSSCNNVDNIQTDETVYEYKDLDVFPYITDSKKNTVTEKKMGLLLKIFEIQQKYLPFNEVHSNFKIPFIINNKGEIKNVDYSEVPKELNDRVKQIFSHFPRSIVAGKKNGVFVNSKMALIFIETGSNEIKEIDELETIPFSTIEKVPTYPGCTGTNEELKKCMAKKITKFISKNFNVDIANSLDLTPGRKRISVQFKIDKNGNPSDVKARAPHPKLQEESIRIIKLLPQMKPGIQHGKAVNVRYNLPIIFNVEE